MMVFPAPVANVGFEAEGEKAEFRAPVAKHNIMAVVGDAGALGPIDFGSERRLLPRSQKRRSGEGHDLFPDWWARRPSQRRYPTVKRLHVWTPLNPIWPEG